MGRLSIYCEEKIAEAKQGKERSIRLLAAIEDNIKNDGDWGPMGKPTQEKIEAKIEKIKYYIGHWEKEIEVWEAEKKLLREI